MKMLFVISICCFCLFTASAVAPVGPYDAKAENGQELACEISVPSEAHVNNGCIDASLIVRNVSGNPVRICTSRSHPATALAKNSRRSTVPGRAP